MTGGKRPEGRTPPFSLRLSFEERAKLERQAGGMPLGTYIKSQVFSEQAETYRKRRKPAEADQKLLAEVLACLGSSRLANNLNQLAKAANTGALFCDAQTKSELTRACDDVRAMRLLLMQALGLKVEDHHHKPETTSQSFARAATRPKRFTP
ncbi:MAG: plasmid mobilization relaxosome protein MobC [Pseudomonadota bacterium]